jgi:cytochrome P450
MPDTGLASHRAEIDLGIFNPMAPEFIRDPDETWRRLVLEYPVAFHRDMGMWVVSSHDLCLKMMMDLRFSPNYRHWEYAPPEKPEAEKDDFDITMDHSLFTVSPKQHLRLRKLTMPAFARHVMSKIDERIRGLIVDCFDAIGAPDEFDAYETIAANLPARAIARMVGVPPEDEKIFIKFSNSVVKATRINLSPEERAEAQHDSLEGYAYLKRAIAERRARPFPSDDFLAALVTAGEADDRLGDWDILAVVMALIAAGADTAVDLHTYVLRGLLSHPEQYRLLQERPALQENAIIEALRQGSPGKLPIFRFATDDIEFGGQTIRKGHAILVNLAAAWRDPQKWQDADKLDITRNLEGHIVFGAGPHFCIGTYLVRAQGGIMLEEFIRRFPHAELAHGDGDLVYDYEHHNARRIVRLNVRTNLGAQIRNAA